MIEVQLDHLVDQVYQEFLDTKVLLEKRDRREKRVQWVFLGQMELGVIPDLLARKV